MTAIYDPSLVTFSIVIAIIASYTALDVAGRVTAAEGLTRRFWLVGGATAMGIGIWSMHFVGMLAYHLPIPMTYDFPIVWLSMLVAIVASGAALSLVSNPKLGKLQLLFGGIFMGCGIASMHYLGMVSMQIEAIASYDIKRVLLSVAIAFSASGISLWLAFQLREANTLRGTFRKLGSAIIMGCAISGMHYTAMAAVTLLPISGALEKHSNAIDNTLLAIAVGVGTLIILAIALIASFFNQRLNVEVAKSEALKESEARFRSLVQNTSDIIVVLTADGNISYISSSAQRILGHASGDWRGKTAFQLVHPEDLANAVNLLSQTLEHPATDTIAQLRLRHCDGNWRDFEVLANNLLNEPTIAGIVMTCRDITERKRVQDSLRESEARFRIMADTAPVMLWMAGIDKHCDYLNKGWLEFTGRTLEQEMGNGWTEGVHPQDLPHCWQTYATAFDARQEFTMEFRLRRFDGEYRWVLNKGIPRFTPTGNFVGYIGSVIDITERKQAEEERERLLERERLARTDAETANRLKDEFLATLSHELRTPLNSMVGWTKLLRTRKFDAVTAARALETIDRNTQALAKLVEDVLDVSSIITGKLRFRAYLVDLIPVIEQAIDSIRPAADAKGIHIAYMLDPAAGPVYGDADRLQQIVWNLLANAIKFTPKGGQVEISLERVDSHVRIKVSDTGQGIDAEFLPFVFDRFRQADSSITRTYGGLGLGLAIVRHLVEMHGGTVSAESAGDGQGATFTVLIPVMAVRMNLSDLEPINVVLERRPTINKPLILDGLRVLVVDDEPDARTLLSVILQQHGAEVMAAASAAETLEMHERFKPHVLVSDIGMPEEDGYQLIRKLRTLPGDRGGQTPAVALTAYAREEERKKCLMAGFQLHVSKPVEPEELVAVVAELAGRTGEM